MKIAIGSDHGGFGLKEYLKKYLEEKGCQLKDFGTFSTDSCDYTDFAFPVAKSVAKGEFDRGVLVCGSGVGVTVTANRIKGIRAVNVFSEYTASQSREHGDSNVICFGGRTTKKEDAVKMLDIWLKTPFSGDERHLRRIKKIDQ